MARGKPPRCGFSSGWSPQRPVRRRLATLAYADLPNPQRTVGCVLDARFHPGRSGRNHLRVLAPTAGASDRRVDELLGEVGLRRSRPATGRGVLHGDAAAPRAGCRDARQSRLPDLGRTSEWPRPGRHPLAAHFPARLRGEWPGSADLLPSAERDRGHRGRHRRDQPGRLLAQMPMSELNSGEGTTRARVSDLEAAMQALAAIGADVETAVDERGAYLRIHSHDVGRVGSALFSAGIAVDELITESAAISSRSSSPCSRVPDERCAACRVAQDQHHASCGGLCSSASSCSALGTRRCRPS